MDGLHMIIGVHMDEATVLGHRIYPDQDRVTVELRPPDDQYRSGRVIVFAHRAELIRLRDTLTGVITELSAACDAAQMDNKQRPPSEAA